MPNVKTKVTESFTLIADDGATYQVHEHTRYLTKNLPGGKRVDLGTSYLKTEDGRGVTKIRDNMYAIPSLKVNAVRQSA